MHDADSTRSAHAVICSEEAWSIVSLSRSDSAPNRCSSSRIRTVRFALGYAHAHRLAHLHVVQREPFFAQACHVLGIRIRR